MGVRALNERVSKGGDWEDKAHAVGMHGTQMPSIHFVEERNVQANLESDEHTGDQSDTLGGRIKDEVVLVGYSLFSLSPIQHLFYTYR